MARPQQFSTDEVLDKAMLLFWEQGYEATSIGELEERTGLSRSSIYQAFRSKRGLFDRVLDRYVDLRIGSMLEQLETGEAGLEAITGFFSRIADAVAHEPTIDGTLGCLMVNSTAELAWRDEAIRPAARRYRRRLQRAFLRALRNAERLGEIPPAEHETRARLLAALTLGAFLVARGNPDPEETEKLLRAVVAEVKAW